MALVTDFLNFLGTTWGKYSMYTKTYAPSFKLRSPEISAQSGAAENQAAKSAGKPGIRRRSTGQEKSAGSYLLSEVASHDKPQDCWVIVKEKVYDVSSFAEEHPGGTVISTYFGRDATDVFATFHPNSAWKLLQTFYIGDLVREVPIEEVLKDYRELRAEFAKEQLFKSSKLFFLLQALINAALFATSIAIISLNKSLWAVLLSASVMGLFVQQCGWLSHDFLHQQVFENRKLNTIFGYLCGNMVLGFSVSWWRTKHNLHHTAPNECDQTYTPIDEDIDTLPLIAWSKEILATVQNPRILRVLQYQHLALVPLLFLARASWLFGSALFTFNPALSPTLGAVEKGTVLLHYVWFTWTAFHVLPGWYKPLVWMMATEAVAGFCLGFVFTLSHNGKEVYNESKDFVNAQIATTRNTKAGWFNDWFTGGLDRQIEHHLFPTMPRHNYPKISPRVEALCKKHGLEYEDVSVASASLAVLRAAKAIADAAALQITASPAANSGANLGAN